MFRLTRMIGSALVPACWSSPGYVVRGAVVVLGLCWVVAGGLGSPGHAQIPGTMCFFNRMDPMWSLGAYSLERAPVDHPLY